MTQLSPARADFPLVPNLKLLSRGKVRDTYLLPGDELLSSATDGISIFDFVLNALVPEKGRILCALNHFWDKYLCQFGIKTHFIAAGGDIKRDGIDLQSRATIVRRLKMAPVEFIARAVLTGSAKKSYAQNGQICGHQLATGLEDGDELPFILDTPTSKAEEGHDENLLADEIRKKYPQQTYSLIQIFQIASAYAKQRGIKIADTKLEFGEDGTLGDEILTPDSSRFWEYSSWLKGRESKTGRKAPAPYDKQFVRAWGIEQGIDKLNPEKPEDVAFVHSLAVPELVIRQTTKIYRYIFWRITGYAIENYLRFKMGVDVFPKKKNVVVICGSESDVPQVVRALDLCFGISVKITVHIMSCHRNPLDVMKFAKVRCKGADAIICAGGKAFALPGIVDAFIHYYGIDIPVVGVALGEPGSNAFEAARLSIEEIPGTPVVINEITGQAYAGLEGFLSAVQRIASGELPPPKPRADKPVRMNAYRKL